LIRAPENASSLVIHTIKKTYKLFDIDAYTFFTSWDITFHESVFSFCQHSQTQSSPPSQYILPAIDFYLPTSVQHSLDPPSSPAHHNAPKPTTHQPFSCTPGSPASITEPSPTNFHVRRSTFL